METRRWVNPSQPQTMQIAVFLFYLRAVFTLLFGLDGQFAVFPFSSSSSSGFSNLFLQLGLPIALALAGWLIANERKSGWKLGVVVAALPLVARLMVSAHVSLGVQGLRHPSPFDYDVVGLIFDVALFALLVHPQSRDYERIWFK